MKTPLTETLGFWLLFVPIVAICWILFWCFVFVGWVMDRLFGDEDELLHVH